MLRFDKCLFGKGRGDCRGHEHGDTAGTADSPNSVIFRIAAKTCEVRLDPFEGGDLIHQGVIARCAVAGLGGELRMRQGPQAEKAVVDRDNDNTSFGETDTVIHRVTAVSDAQAAAVKPNHDRASFVGIDGTCPNIQIQAVFRHLLAAPDPGHDERAAIRLRADRSEIGSIRSPCRELPALAGCHRRRRSVPRHRECQGTVEIRRFSGQGHHGTGLGDPEWVVARNTDR